MAAFLTEGDFYASPMIEAKAFSFTYPGAADATLQQVSFTLQPGQISLLLGPSGSGKTTLLRQLKPVIAPKGDKGGCLFYAGREIDTLFPLEVVSQIGFVFQQPEAQLVMETVYEELAFGLENLALPAEEIQEIIADTVNFCGIEHLLDQKTASLSGGQKQLVNLCAVLCLRPQVLLLDEPFSQLDPESVLRMLQLLQRLRTEMGVTILISEQRLEQLWSWVDQVLFLTQGKIAFIGSPRDFVAYQQQQTCPFALPAISQIFAKSGEALYALPLSLAEGRSLLSAWQIPPQTESCSAEKLGEWADKPWLLKGKDVSFAYANSPKIVLQHISLTLHAGERLVLCGSNGAGKTTLLHTIAGVVKPRQGKWQKKEKDTTIAFLAQQAQHHFLYDTPHDEFAARNPRYQQDAAFMEILEKLEILPFLHRDIYTLSVGQQQRVALAMVLGVPADVYVLDEPTKGLDDRNKQALGEILQQKTASAVMMASHDLEFAAAFGNGFTTLCHGKLTPVQPPQVFFHWRYWQTTVTAKLFAGFAPWYSADQVPENWHALLKAKEDKGQK